MSPTTRASATRVVRCSTVRATSFADAPRWTRCSAIFTCPSRSAYFRAK
ncbi:hypothetical protein QP157_13140 [Sphingomonas sp. LR61]